MKKQDEKELREEALANWFDEALEQPENCHPQEDGSTLYGYLDEPNFFSQAYWHNVKNALEAVWQAKNPFNEHRSVMKACLPLVHPDAYRIFFPFSHLKDLIDNIIDPPGTREDAWVEFWGSSFGEILLLCIFGFSVAGIAVLFFT